VVLKRFAAVIDMLCTVEEILDVEQRLQLASTLRRMEITAARYGVLTV
jgi:hypothetical protein